MTCQNCGAENPQPNAFCQNCGTRIDQAPLDPQPATPGKSNHANNKTLLIGAIAAGALACLCVCTLLAGAFLFSQNASEASARPTLRSTPTRRATISSPTDEPTDILAPAPKALATPVPPAGKNWTTLQVTNAFRHAKLDISNPRPMTNDDYGNVPHLASEAVRFFLPTLGGQKGGRIYAFAASKDLQTVRQYYDSGESAAASPPWIFVKDNILVQISGDLPEKKAKQYQAALETLQ